MNKFENTYCNPIPLPDYPIGRDALKADRQDEYNWRETADPTVLYENGKWYLYSSCGMMYVSEDFRTWTHIKAEPYDCGYAPTVVKHKGKFYLCSSLSELFVADVPTGPFVSLGAFVLPNGDRLTRNYDPMLFSDDDGRFYLYYTTGAPEILGVELDADNPIQLLSEPAVQIRYNPDHVWERMGEYNDDGSRCSLEGPWMFKRNGVYYLTYGAPATEFSTYAMGAYKGSSPLGEWSYMVTSPFTRKCDGLVRGPGHGSIVEGPNGTLWAFYTTTICYMDPMERRIGYDPIYINENGDLVCDHITENPQWAPGVVSDPHINNDAGLVNVTGRRRPKASSEKEGRDALYATDEDLMSFWQPDDSDEEPTLTIPLAYYGINCTAVRILFRDVNLSLAHGNLPGPIKYKLELRDFNKSREWTTVVDRTESEEDFIVDYRTFEPTRANEARLVITGWPKGIKPAVMNISIFGWWTEE